MMILKLEARRAEDLGVCPHRPRLALTRVAAGHAGCSSYIDLRSGKPEKANMGETRRTGIIGWRFWPGREECSLLEKKQITCGLLLLMELIWCTEEIWSSSISQQHLTVNLLMVSWSEEPGSASFPR